MTIERGGIGARVRDRVHRAARGGGALASFFFEAAVGFRIDAAELSSAKIVTCHGLTPRGRGAYCRPFT